MPAGLVGEGGGHRDRVRPAEQFVEPIVRPGLADLVTANGASQPDRLHLEGGRQSGDLAADRSETDDPEPHAVRGRSTTAVPSDGSPVIA